MADNALAISGSAASRPSTPRTASGTQEKPPASFSTVELIIVWFFIGTSALASIIGDMVSPTGIGLVIYIIADVYAAVVGAFIQIWMFRKGVYTWKDFALWILQIIGVPGVMGARILSVTRKAQTIAQTAVKNAEIAAKAGKKLASTRTKPLVQLGKKVTKESVESRFSNRLALGGRGGQTVTPEEALIGGSLGAGAFVGGEQQIPGANAQKTLADLLEEDNLLAESPPEFEYLRSVTAQNVPGGARPSSVPEEIAPGEQQAQRKKTRPGDLSAITAETEAKLAGAEKEEELPREDFPILPSEIEEGFITEEQLPVLGQASTPPGGAGAIEEEGVAAGGGGARGIKEVILPQSAAIKGGAQLPRRAAGQQRPAGAGVFGSILPYSVTGGASATPQARRGMSLGSAKTAAPGTTPASLGRGGETEAQPFTSKELGITPGYEELITSMETPGQLAPPAPVAPSGEYVVDLTVPVAAPEPEVGPGSVEIPAYRGSASTTITQKIAAAGESQKQRQIDENPELFSQLSESIFTPSIEEASDILPTPAPIIPTPPATLEEGIPTKQKPFSAKQQSVEQVLERQKIRKEAVKQEESQKQKETEAEKQRQKKIDEEYINRYFGDYLNQEPGDGGQQPLSNTGDEKIAADDLYTPVSRENTVVLKSSTANKNEADAAKASADAHAAEIEQRYEQLISTDSQKKDETPPAK